MGDGFTAEALAAGALEAGALEAGAFADTVLAAGVFTTGFGSAGAAFLAAFTGFAATDFLVAALAGNFFSFDLGIQGFPIYRDANERDTIGMRGSQVKGCRNSSAL